MGWNTLLIGCIAHLALLQTGDAECTLDRKVIVLEGNNNLKYGMECREAGEFLTTLNFRVESAALAITMEESSLCFVRGCCTSFLYSQLRHKIDCSIDYEAEAFIKIGDSVGECRCRASESGIVDTTARCDRFIRDGSGWNLVAAYKNGTLCGPCPGGSHLVDNICQPCDEGSYSDGAECKPCPRGRYTEGKGASECLYCPAGHTTYTHTPNTCVGPQLEGLDRTKRNAVFSVRVSYDTLGNQERRAVYWKSVGDWNLLNRYKRKFAKITQKYTTSYRRGPRVIRKSHVTTAVRQIIKDVYCYSGSGKNYAGYENKSKFGGVCRGPSEHCTTMNRERVCYCRNKATESHSKPYCEGQDGAEEDCDVPKCNDQERSVHQVTRCGYEKNTDVSSIESVSSSIGFADNDSARKVCDKLGGECKGVWGKGNSWRVTGLSPTEQGTGSYEYYKKDPHCPNPYHQYYFQQE